MSIALFKSKYISTACNRWTRLEKEPTTCKLNAAASEGNKRHQQDPFIWRFTFQKLVETGCSFYRQATSLGSGI